MNVPTRELREAEGQTVSFLLEKYVALRVAFTEKSLAAAVPFLCADSTECVRVERAFVKSNYMRRVHAFLKTKSDGPRPPSAKSKRFWIAIEKRWQPFSPFFLPFPAYGKGPCIYTRRHKELLASATRNARPRHRGAQYRVIKGTARVAKIFQADFAVKTFRSNSGLPVYIAGVRARMFHSRALQKTVDSMLPVWARTCAFLRSKFSIDPSHMERRAF